MSAAENLDFDQDDSFPTLEQVHAGFTVTDLSSAEWALRKIARSQAWLDQQREMYEAERDRLDTWIAGCRQDHDDTASFFGRMLENYHRIVLEDDPRRKTVKLPSGELVARKSPETVTVVDPEAFVCEHGFDSPLVRVKASPDMAAVKQAVKDGEALPGVELVPGEVRFSVKPAAPVAAPPPFDPADPF